MIKRILVFVMMASFLSQSLVSCSDNDEITEPQVQFGPEQTPVQHFVRRLTLDLRVSADATVGSILEFQKDGRITQLCMEAPFSGGFQLVLWDLTDTSVIASERIGVVAEVLECADIPNVQVVAGARMAVTMTGGSFGQYNNGGGSLYPSTSGDVKILSTGITLGSLDVQFPGSTLSTLYNGISDVVFEPKID